MERIAFELGGKGQAENTARMKMLRPERLKNSKVELTAYVEKS